MDKTAIKNFAINARNKLISDIKLKAAMLGITENGITSKLDTSTSEIEYYVDDRNAITGSDIEKRQKLVTELNRRVKDDDFKTAFNDLVEEVAYTWFNRLIAIRFMEVNDYLPSRTNVLSSTSGRHEPDIMVDPMSIEASLDNFTLEEKALIMKAQETEATTDMDNLYHMLFIKQANALNANLPYLFEKTNDYAELLFTPNYHDGVIHDLITTIDQDDFDVEKGGQVEIIGWLYQYYNTEPKDIAFKKKKYTPSDIPAVTQLFTPDWLVKYMVENSLGRYWIDILHAKGDQRSAHDIAVAYGWTYFMPAARQTDTINIKLNDSKVDLRSVTVEDVTVIDPAMGSGHILIYAFEIFMQIYESEGYAKREAARLILQKNLYGLDIDVRAFQLSYFALMMKIREYNRRALSIDVEPNIFYVPKLNYLRIDDFIDEINDDKAQKNLKELLTAFNHGDDYGSLINFQDQMNWEALETLASLTDSHGQMLLNIAEQTDKKCELAHIIQIAKLLSRQYDIGIMNPPYMGSGKMNTVLGSYVRHNFPEGKSDLFAAFMQRLKIFTKSNGYYAMVTQHAWMFLSSFEKLRRSLRKDMIVNMAHLGTRAFEEIGGEVVQSTSFILKKQNLPDYIGTYERLIHFGNQQEKEQGYLEAVHNPNVNYLYRTNQANFEKIPGRPIAYWLSKNIIETFTEPNIGDYINTREGMATANNNLFLRYWFEIAIHKSSIFQDSSNNLKWFPYNKGGKFKKWGAYQNYLVNWENDGFEIRNNVDPKTKRIRSHNYNGKYAFQIGITWSSLSSGNISVRYSPYGYLFDSKGAMGFSKTTNDILYIILGLLNSKVSMMYLNLFSPTLDFKVGDIILIPVITKIFNCTCMINLVKNNIEISMYETNFFENSWDFTRHPLLAHIADDKQKEVDGKLKNAFSIWRDEAQARFDQLKANEEELNRIFIDLYGLNDELTPDVADKDVSVRLADETRDIKSFLSYFVGVVFGRYSLDIAGLAFAGGQWDNHKYQKFVPNKDNLLLLNDARYFDDARDIINRLKEFLGTTFGNDSVQENIDYIASVVGKKAMEPELAIRKYFIDDFFKDHKKIYQKRPIYWEFNSGKQSGFKALMYLHRYDKGELAMIRTDYLHPLQGMYENRLDHLQQLVINEPIAKVKKQLEKDIKHLTQQITELKEYDPLIQHLANKQIELDLDDGVLVNYAKLQDGEKILSKI